MENRDDCLDDLVVSDLAYKCKKLKAILESVNLSQVAIDERLIIQSSTMYPDPVAAMGSANPKHLKGI